MTLRPPDDFGDLLSLLDADPVHAEDSERVKAAILADGRAHDGHCNPNRIRLALTNPSGHLDVFHKSVGPAYYSLKAAGLIVEAAPIRSDDKRGRNAGKWCKTYILTAAGWAA